MSLELTLTIPLITHSHHFRGFILSDVFWFFFQDFSSLAAERRQTVLVYLFFLIPLVTHSFSPDRSLGLGL